MRHQVIITSNLTYSAKDEAGARGSLPEQVLARLTTLGASDGNTFRIASARKSDQFHPCTTPQKQRTATIRFTGSIGRERVGLGLHTTIYKRRVFHSQTRRR